MSANLGGMGALLAVTSHEQLKQIFVKAGATTRETAKTLKELGLDQSRLLRSMLKAGGVVEVSNRYYLRYHPRDERKRSRRLAVAMVIVVAAFVLTFVVMGLLTLLSP